MCVVGGGGGCVGGGGVDGEWRGEKLTIQDGTAIHEDRAAYAISTSSLTMEVESVTHALRLISLRDDSQTTHAIILADSMSLHKKWNGKPRLDCVDGRYPPSKPCGCIALGPAGVEGND